jgi:uncharacterized membrane protein
MDNIERLRGSRHLRRLEMLIDVVFALLIWDIVSTLPLPDGTDLNFAGLGEFLGGNLDLGIVLIGMVIVLNYWAQNNAHSGELDATDSTHALLSILQLFFLLFYTYAAALGMQFEGDETALALQSLTLLLAGILGFAAWAYAIRDGRLLADYAREEEVSALLVRSLAEPLTALITLPLAFVSATLWELAWLLYIPLAWYLGRKRHALNTKFRLAKKNADED